jgi:hypothetical protein
MKMYSDKEIYDVTTALRLIIEKHGRELLGQCLAMYDDAFEEHMATTADERRYAAWEDAGCPSNGDIYPMVDDRGR